MLALCIAAAGILTYFIYWGALRVRGMPHTRARSTNIRSSQLVCAQYSRIQLSIIYGCLCIWYYKKNATHTSNAPRTTWYWPYYLYESKRLPFELDESQMMLYHSFLAAGVRGSFASAYFLNVIAKTQNTTNHIQNFAQKTCRITQRANSIHLDCIRISDGFRWAFCIVRDLLFWSIYVQSEAHVFTACLVTKNPWTSNCTRLLTRAKQIPHKRVCRKFSADSW